MIKPIHFETNPEDSDLARMYRLQVLEVEDFAMFLADAEGRITTWNRGVKHIFGYDENEWVGQHSSIVFTEEDLAANVHEEEMRSAAEQGRTVDVRWHRHKDGRRIYMTGGHCQVNGNASGRTVLVSNECCPTKPVIRRGQMRRSLHSRCESVSFDGNGNRWR
jgi:PAS domain S-box-containing protein